MCDLRQLMEDYRLLFEEAAGGPVNDVLEFDSLKAAKQLAGDLGGGSGALELARLLLRSREDHEADEGA